MDLERHKHKPGSFVSTSNKALNVLKSITPELMLQVKTHLQDETIGQSRLFHPDTLKAVVDSSLAERLAKVKDLADCLENSSKVKSTATMTLCPLPESHARILGSIFDICAVSEDVYGEKDRQMLLVRHGSKIGLQDISVMFPSTKLGTDPEFFSLDPRMNAELIRQNSSVRFALGIKPNQRVQWGAITALTPRCADKYMSPPNGTKVDSRIASLCVVNWTDKKGQHSALLQIMSAQRINAVDGLQQNGLSRVISKRSGNDTYTTVDKNWKIRVMKTM
jgi:hypothetical protein